MSGKFEGDGLTDDVAGLSDTDLKAIVGWRDFYHRVRPRRRARYELAGSDFSLNGHSSMHLLSLLRRPQQCLVKRDPFLYEQYWQVLARRAPIGRLARWHASSASSLAFAQALHACSVIRACRATLCMLAGMGDAYALPMTSPKPCVPDMAGMHHPCGQPTTAC